MAAITHINKKRQFQPIITTHFTPKNAPYFTPTGQPTNTSISPSGLLSPSIPLPVQSNLLTMGMRIRKSINDGYQTKANPTSELPVVSNNTDNTTTINTKAQDPDLDYLIDTTTIDTTTFDLDPHSPHTRIEHTDTILGDIDSDDDFVDFSSARQLFDFYIDDANFTKKRAYYEMDIDVHAKITYSDKPPVYKPVSPRLRPVAQPKTRKRAVVKNGSGKVLKVEEEEDFDIASFLLERELIA